MGSCEIFGPIQNGEGQEGTETYELLRYTNQAASTLYLHCLDQIDPGQRDYS